MREMKSSGVDWLGDIPRNWNVVYPKSLFSLRKEKAAEGERQLTASQQLGIVYQDEYMATTGQRVVVVEKDFSILKHVEAGDFVISMRSFQGGLEYSQVSGSISSAYVMLIPNRELVHSPFFKWLFKSEGYIKALYSTSDLIRDGQAMRYSNFIQVPLFVAPLDEQIRIANYLDRRCYKIDALIANQQAQIEKLKQYKQSLITEVVTKGLNPDAPMKDSKVESIGRIPAHWILKRAKYVATSLIKGNGITKEEVFDDGDIQCVRYGEIYSKYDCAFVSAFSKTKKEIMSSPQYISYGDILFAGTGELVEEIGKNIVYLGTEPCLAGGDIVVMSHNQNPEYLNYALYGACSQTQKSRGKAKLKVVHISATEIGNVVVALPPLDEQEVIAEYLNKKCKQINRLIAIKEKKIERLGKYKRSVIYEYVTGKREVV